jgi:hypothetical protein
MGAVGAIAINTTTGKGEGFPLPSANFMGLVKA